MAWDAQRPIPWQRLLREAAIFLVIGAFALTLLVNKKDASTYVGLVVGMIVYVAVVAVLSKFGYERQTYRQARDRRRAAAAAPRAVGTAVAQGNRPRPAPTRRTSTGPSQRPNRSTKKRRR